ncbi:MAG: hypothetical protein AABZ08_01960 [Planctomycetota bacterium]
MAFQLRCLNYLPRACLLFASLTLLAGCPPQPGVSDTKPRPPRGTDDIVTAIAENTAKLDRALWSNSVSVSARFRDERGQAHAYNLEGTLLFRSPRDLRIDLRHALSERVMGIGSNATDYWVWIEPDLGLLRWGRHEHAHKPCAEKIPVRPDQLAAVLGFDGLPHETSDFIGPIRKSGHEFDILTYSHRTAAGRWRLDREYFVDRKPPNLIRLVAFYDEFGRRIMSALLDDHRAAWEGGPLVPHQINISWPTDDANFNLSALAIEGRTTVSPRAFIRPAPADLPAGVRDVVQVDADCDTAPTSAPSN